MKLMITNGGPHPADKHAAVTAESILDLIQVSDDANTPEAANARRAKLELLPKLAAILEAHFDGVQNHEKTALAAKGGMKRLNAGLDPSAHVDDPLAEVLAAINSYPVLEHYFGDSSVNGPVMQNAVKSIVAQRIATAMHIERSWHADGNPDHPEAQAFKSAQPDAPTS